DRLWGLDGRVVVDDWSTSGWALQEGVDYRLPENLSLAWEPGEGGAKSFEIDLLRPDPDASETKSFSLNGNGRIEGTEATVYVYGSVIILPQGAQVHPVIDPAAVDRMLNSFNLTLSAVQGAIIELEK